MISNGFKKILKKTMVLGTIMTVSVSMVACGGKKKNKGTENETVAVSTETSSGESENTVASLGITYKGDGYTISAPTNWADAKTSNESLDLMIYDTDITGDFARNLNIIIEDLSSYSAMNSEKYLEAANTKLIQTGYVIDETGSIQINGEDATYLVYNYTTNGYTIKGLQTYIYDADNKQVYVITFACSNDEFDEHRSEGEEIISSFLFDKE